MQKIYELITVPPYDLFLEDNVTLLVNQRGALFLTNNNIVIMNGMPGTKNAIRDFSKNALKS